MQSSVPFAVLHSQRAMLGCKSCTCLLSLPAAATAAVCPAYEQSAYLLAAGLQTWQAS